jgi:hypothetical protein
MLIKHEQAGRARESTSTALFGTSISKPMSRENRLITVKAVMKNVIIDKNKPSIHYGQHRGKF